MKFPSAIALVLLTTTLVHAHAFLQDSDPAVGSTVPMSPPQVKIWFTEKLNRASSRIEVFDAGGAEVDGKDSRVDSANPLLMTVSLPALPAGHYKVKWSAVAVDTHHTTGTFGFDVNP